MLSWEEDVELHALVARGWTISAIARHMDRDRKTIRDYLSGKRTPGVRVRGTPDEFVTFERYCRLRLADDPHLWGVTLYDEVRGLGYAGGYSTFTRALRERKLRPHCEACAASRGRDHAIISHPPGEETQWDWVELPDPPKWWGLSGHAHLLVGALSHSSLWRGWLAEAEDLAHLVEAIGEVVARLGGLTRVWRFDRMSTVHTAAGHLSAGFAAVAKFYGVDVAVCPPRHGNRKGVVEKANHSAAQRWWRTLSDDTSPVQAQASLDRRSASLDERRRVRDGQKLTVADLAAAEGLRAAPAGLYPAELTVERGVSPQGLVSFRGNRYSVGPGLSGAQVLVGIRLGSATLRISTPGGLVLAEHRRAPDGAGALVRDDAHVAALEKAVLSAFSDARPCNHKTRRPPSLASRSEAARLRGAPGADAASHVVIDMAEYAAAAARLASVSSTSGRSGGVEDQESA